MSNITTERKSLSGRALAILAGGAALFVAIALTITYRRQGLDVGGPDFLIDPNFGIPTPPKMDPPANAVAKPLAIGVPLCTLLFCFAARDAFKTRSLLPIAMVFSGAMIAFPEVFFDVIGAVYYPVAKDAVVYKILGRDMPGTILLGWTVFGGAVGYVVYKVIASNPTTKWVWLTWLIFGLTSGVLEEGIASGGYHYYANQPLILISIWPWWWMPCNSIGVFLAVSIAYRYRASFRSWKALAMFFITPMSVTAVYGAIALPSWIVVNANYGWLLTQCGGLLTIALGLIVLYFIIDRVLNRDPFDFDRREPPEHAPAGTVAY